jgi:fumarylacetoacetate (FAA) hydrolase
MRLATLRDGTRDGALLVVDPSGERAAPARDVAPTLQAALDDWHAVEPRLRAP